MARIFPLILRIVMILSTLLLFIGPSSFAMYILAYAPDDNRNALQTVVSIMPFRSEERMVGVAADGTLEQTDSQLQLTESISLSTILNILVAILLLFEILALISSFIESNALGRTSTIFSFIIGAVMLFFLLVVKNGMFQILTSLNGVTGEELSSSFFYNEYKIHAGNADYYFVSGFGVGFIFLLLAIISSFVAIFPSVVSYDWEEWDDEYDEDY